jgi:hypothetical protein
MRPLWRQARGWFLGAALALVVLGGLAYVARADLRHWAAHVTGEDDLREQIKGVGALALLRLSHAPPRTDPLVPIAHTGLPPYGINIFLEQEADPAKVDYSLRLVSEAGFYWVRQQFPWEDIEIAGKGDYWDPVWDKSTWAKYDHIVDLAERYNLQIIARLDNPPAWTRAVGDAPGWTMAPPDNYEDYGDFVAAVVGRYKGRIRYYQLWNEPNISPEWGDQPADAAAFVELLKIGYTRAKEADPDCVIIAAGLAQTTEETPAEFGPRNVSDLLYLEQMYAAGAKGYFDIMGAQVYGLWTGPYDRRTSRDRSNFSRVQMLRQIMVANGDGDKPIWATEVGWNALPEEFPAFPNYGRVSEEQQAVYAIEAYRRAAREWPWMGVMNYWFLRRPSDAERNQTWYYFRMFEPDFEPLPVYGALAWLAQQPPAVPVGHHQQDHRALHYEGPWQHVGDAQAVLGGYALGDVGATLDFHFEGTDLALVLRDPAQIAHLTITIDGREHKPLPTWMAPRTGSVAVPVARFLSDDTHTAHLVVTQVPVALDGLVVWRRSGLWAAWGWCAGVLAALAGGTYLARRLRRRPRA